MYSTIAYMQTECSSYIYRLFTKQLYLNKCVGLSPSTTAVKKTDV